jgi:hypothetical protein
MKAARQAIAAAFGYSGSSVLIGEEPAAAAAGGDEATQVRAGRAITHAPGLHRL